LIRSDTSIKAALKPMQLFLSIGWGGRDFRRDSLSNPLLDRPGISGPLGATTQAPSGLGMVVGIPCMTNTATKINKVYINLITTLAACCG
jgi:hypothetical protein